LLGKNTEENPHVSWLLLTEKSSWSNSDCEVFKNREFCGKEAPSKHQMHSSWPLGQLEQKTATMQNWC